MTNARTQPFDVERWPTLAVAVSPVQPGDLITVGFDGAQFHDATRIACTHVPSGYQWVAGLWECPPGRTDWQVPTAAVDAAMRQ